MGILVAQTLPYRGRLQPAYSACDGAGDTVQNFGNVILHIQNSSGSSRTVTIARNATSPRIGSNAVYTIPAGGEIIAGPFPSGDYDTVGGGSVNGWTDRLGITYSDASGLTIAAVAINMHATTEARYS